MTSLSELTLSQAIALFLQHNGSKHIRMQQELNKLTRWFQGNKLLTSITPAEIEAYAERLPPGASQNEEHIKPLRAFFLFAKKEGLISQNFLGSPPPCGREINEISPPDPSRMGGEITRNFPPIPLQNGGEINIENRSK